MRITFVRHATFALKMDGTTVMVDPMLACAGATDPVAGTAVNHCLLGRNELEESLRREGLSERVKIPADGESFEMP